MFYAVRKLKRGQSCINLSNAKRNCKNADLKLDQSGARVRCLRRAVRQTCEGAR